MIEKNAIRISSPFKFRNTFIHDRAKCLYHLEHQEQHSHSIVTNFKSGIIAGLDPNLAVVLSLFLLGLADMVCIQDT